MRFSDFRFQILRFFSQLKSYHEHDGSVGQLRYCRVTAATSESNTGENWSSIIQICEMADASADKAKETIQSLIKRLQSKNVNVLLFSLTLSNALVVNCSLEVRREISSRPYLDCLKKLLEGKTHITVKNRIAELMKSWANEFRNESSLSYMVDTVEMLNLPSNPPSPQKQKQENVNINKEEEELQLALALSLSQHQQQFSRPDDTKKAPKPKTLFSVRALYDFNASEEGELGLRAGDIVQVHDCTTFPDWWMGTFEGNHGIFPSNYVEKIVSESETEKDMEVYLLSQLERIRKLKQAIAQADPLGNNYVENERLAVNLK